jgi:hypothetical protein
VGCKHNCTTEKTGPAVRLSRCKDSICPSLAFSSVESAFLLVRCDETQAPCAEAATQSPQLENLTKKKNKERNDEKSGAEART